MRALRKVAREAEAEYIEMREAFLAWKRAGFLSQIVREDAVCVLTEKRYWCASAERRIAEAESRGVVVGAAWSPNALARVRAAHRTLPARAAEGSASSPASDRRGT